MGQTVPNNQQSNNQYSLFGSQVAPQPNRSSISSQFNQSTLQNSRVAPNRSEIYRAAPLNSSQIYPMNQVQHQMQPIIQYPKSPARNLYEPEPTPQNLAANLQPSKINIIPQLGFTGSSLKKINDVQKDKHVSFESGLEELLIIRQHLRSSKAYFSKIYPIMQQELTNIRNAIENQLKTGIPDRSKLFYHLAQEKNYNAIFAKISQCKENIGMSIDVLRKKNNVTKQEFTIIINITNDASAFVKNLAKELPTNGWNAILTNNNTALYNSLVALAQKDKDIVQAFQALQINMRNPNFHYVKPLQSQNLYESRTFSLVEGPVPEPAKRPSTPLVKHPSYIN